MTTGNALSRIALAAILLSAVGMADASELELSLRYLGSLDAEFNPKKPVLCPGCESLAEPDDYHAFGVYMRLIDPAPNEDFWAVQFDIDLGPGLLPADFGGWVGNDVQFDPPGPAPPISIWMDNADAGSNPNDFVRILALSNNPAGMAALQLGEASPFLLGTAYLRWNTVSNGSISLTPNAPDNWGTYVDGIRVVRFANDFSEGPADFLSICVVPEPTNALSIGGVAISLLVVHPFRRRLPARADSRLHSLTGLLRAAGTDIKHFKDIIFEWWLMKIGDLYKFALAGFLFACLYNDGIGASARAATLHVTMQYVGSFDSSFNALGLPLQDDPLSVAPTDYHQFSVFYELLNPAANEDFLGMQFDINRGPGFTPAAFGGWIPNLPMVDPPGPQLPIAIYSENVDGGSENDDLNRIIVIARSPAEIPGRHPGESGPEKAGDFYVQWSGSFGPDGTTKLSLVPNNPSPWATYIGTAPIAQPASTFTVGPDFIVTVPVPEPASGILLTLAAVAMLVRRSRCLA